MRPPATAAATPMTLPALLLVLALLAASLPRWAHAGVPIPIAYAISATNGDYFIAYGNNGTHDHRRNFPSADFFCRAYTSGTLASIRYENETKVLLALDRHMNYQLPVHSSFTAGTKEHNGCCNWVGLYAEAPGRFRDNADMAAFTDDTEVIQKSVGKREGNFKPAAYVDSRTFKGLPWCAALCNAKQFKRDCDTEFNNFICRTALPPPTVNASGVVHVTDFVKPCGSPTTPDCPLPAAPGPNAASRCMASAKHRRQISSAGDTMSNCFPPGASSFSFERFFGNRSLTCQRLPSDDLSEGPVTCVVA